MIPDALIAIIKRDLTASGPKTFPEIRRYVHAQYAESTPDWSIAEALNHLIRERQAYLYDTGDAFDATRPDLTSEPLPG